MPDISRKIARTVRWARMKAFVELFAGGSAGQVLTKNSTDEDDFGWADAGGGSSSASTAENYFIAVGSTTAITSGTFASVGSVASVPAGDYVFHVGVRHQGTTADTFAWRLTADAGTLSGTGGYTQSSLAVNPASNCDFAASSQIEFDNWIGTIDLTASATVALELNRQSGSSDLDVLAGTFVLLTPV